MGEDDKKITFTNPIIKLGLLCIDLIEKPVIWFRENIVVPNRKEYYWYHEKIRRVPTIDECYEDDQICRYEAEEQFKLDKKIDNFILRILRKRYDICMFENMLDQEVCTSLHEAFLKAENNYFIKYGDLGMKCTAFRCLMKQKNRMAWERRHGPVGTGRKVKENVLNE